jgi:hypothetical protein
LFDTQDTEYDDKAEDVKQTPLILPVTLLKDNPCGKAGFIEKLFPSRTRRNGKNDTVSPTLNE